MSFPTDFDIFSSASAYLPIYNIPSKTVWTPDEDDLLKSLVNQYGAHGWSEIAEKVNAKKYKYFNKLLN